MDELIISTGVSLDLQKGIPIPLNLSIADFKEPDKRQRNFSKEIDLPGTAKNQQFFATAFNLTRIGGAYDFNSSAKVNCTYYKRGVPVLRDAVLKLNKVVINDKEISFKVGLFAEFVDIFLLLSTLKVSELNWTDLNHTLNPTNISGSWSTPLGEGYYYPLVERNSRLGPTKWRVTDMVPYVHLTDVFRRCMDFAGLTYTSSFLSSNRAKSILFGFGGGNYLDNAISPTELNNRKVLLSGGDITFSQQEEITNPLAQYSGFTTTGGTEIFGAFTLSNPLAQLGGGLAMSITEDQDIYSQFTPNTFTAQRSGKYRLTLAGTIRVQYSGSFTYQSGGGCTLYYIRNGTMFPLANLVQTSADQTFALNASVNFEMNQGDILQLTVGPAFMTYQNGTIGALITRDITTTVPLTLEFTCTDNTVVEGSTVEMQRFLPDMKCSDFVLGVIKAFNMMISDPDLYGSVKIEPTVGFYQGTNVFTDITEEVDHSKDIEIRPTANEFAKRLIYTWKVGTETDAKDYQTKWPTGYGNLAFDQPSFFAKGEQKIELPFANIIPHQVAPSLLVPRFVDIDSQGNKKPTAGVPRLMMRNGLKTGAWQLVGASTNNYTTYPSVHHFDNWQNPTFDLNFKLAEEVFYLATIVTTNNLYSEYYEASVNEIISSEGKYVQLYRKMDQVKVKNIDWTKLLMWNGALFKFNKVVDFDSEITQSTKIEMIKVLEPRSYNRRQLVISRKIPPLWKKNKGGLKNSVGTGVPVISGGKGNQVLELNKKIQG